MSIISDAAMEAQVRKVMKEFKIEKKYQDVAIDAGIVDEVVTNLYSKIEAAIVYEYNCIAENSDDENMPTMDNDDE